MTDADRRAGEPRQVPYRRPRLGESEALARGATSAPRWVRAGASGFSPPKKHYYARESVGIACGLFIAAVHRMGLATLTHTPSPMGFLSEILSRPKLERPFVLLPVSYQADDCVVPDFVRTSLDKVADFIEGEMRER